MMIIRVITRITILIILRNNYGYNYYNGKKSVHNVGDSILHIIGKNTVWYDVQHHRQWRRYHSTAPHPLRKIKSKSNFGRILVDAVSREQNGMAI